MNGPRLISEAIPHVAEKVFSKKYIMLGRLVTRWEDIVGADLAHKTQPVKIHYRKAKGDEKQSRASLDIATATADATVLHYQKDLILERINQIFGDRWITSIRFVPAASNAQGKLPPRKPRPLPPQDKARLTSMIEGVQDEEMQNRLENLGAAILQDERSGL